MWSQTGNYFGQNKVLYKEFDWAVFRTEHFDVHYYPEEGKAAQDAARMAERGYDYWSEVLHHEIKERIPLILYASLNDFQQTNVVDGILDQGTRWNLGGESRLRVGISLREVRLEEQSHRAKPRVPGNLEGCRSRNTRGGGCEREVE